MNKSKQHQISNSKTLHKTKVGSSVWLVAFSIAIITFIVFSPSLKCGFTNYDDEKFIVHNHLITNNTLELKKIFTDVVSKNDYYPITILSYALNYQSGKLDPFGFHLWNLILHTINTLFVFLFIFIITKRNLLFTSIVALFFGIHPMHVESVTWVTERKDVLVLFFFLAGLLTYLRYRELRKSIWYSITLILFILACLSKAIAVIFPAILLLLDYLLNTKLNKKFFFEKIPFILISVAFIILTYFLHKNGSLQMIVENKSLLHRIVFASYDIFWYIFKFFIPNNLSAYYPYPDEKAMPLIYWLSPFILLFVLIIFYIYFRKEKPIIFGLLFYFISIALMLQIIPTGSGDFNMADRYSYISYIGLLFVAAYFINLIYQKKNKIRIVIMSLTILYAILFSYQTYARTKVWLNSETLWTDAIKINTERCDLGYLNRGEYYKETIKNNEQALSDFNKAININPKFYYAYNNRGLIYLEQKQYELALIDFNKAIELKPNFAHTYNNRGLLFFNQGNYDLAIADYNKCIELDPNYSISYCNRGLVYAKKGLFDLALIEYKKSIEFDPEYYLAYFNRADLFWNIKQYDLALADYNETINFNPFYSDAYYDRGGIYFMRKQYDLALTDYLKATELNSEMPYYWLSRSKAENMLGNKVDAKADALKAKQLGVRGNSLYFQELGI